MKIILIIAAVFFIMILALGFLFIRWANSPENVEATRKEYAEDAAKKIEDEKKQAEQAKEIASKKANLKLVIDESFADNRRFESLDYREDPRRPFKFNENQFSYYVTPRRGSSPGGYFISSKEDFGDFTAELDYGIWGRNSCGGIFWDAPPNGEENPTVYNIVYSTPNMLYVKAGDSDSFGIGSFLESVTGQKLRIEKFGNHLTVSDNGDVLFDQNVKNAGQGRLGIYLGHRGIDEDSSSVIVDVKSFKVWK